MSFRDDILAGVVDPLRYLPDTTFGLRTFTVTLVRREWQALGSLAPEVGQGTYVDVETELMPRPKVREAGGISSAGQLVVDKITPKNANGGYEPDDLLPPPETGVEFFWKVEGPFAKGLSTQEFEVVNLDTGKPFSYKVTLQSRNRTNPT
jgi:hypothetical protein